MSLEERNETVLILTYYDAIGSIASIIMNAADIEVERYRRKGRKGAANNCRFCKSFLVQVKTLDP